MRKASEQEYFPYGSKLVCYIELTKDNEIKQIQNYVQDKRDIYYRVKNDGSKLYAVWPGQYRSDLFEIDDIELYGKEYIKEPCYEGYGRFGEYDVYEEVAKWNKDAVPAIIERIENNNRISAFKVCLLLIT